MDIFHQGKHAAEFQASRKRGLGRKWWQSPSPTAFFPVARLALLCHQGGADQRDCDNDSTGQGREKGLSQRGTGLQPPLITRLFPPCGKRRFRFPHPLHKRKEVTDVKKIECRVICKMRTVEGAPQSCSALSMCPMWRGARFPGCICLTYLSWLFLLVQFLQFSSLLPSRLRGRGRSLGITCIEQALWQLCQEGVHFQVRTPGFGKGSDLPKIAHLRGARARIWIWDVWTQCLNCYILSCLSR